MLEGENELRSYEVGYLLDPGLPVEEASAAVVSQFKDAISARGGKPTVETQVRSTRLAYKVKKMVQNKYHRFSEAYFGALKFEVAPEAITELIATWQKSEQILRFLVVSAPVIKLRPKVELKEGEDKVKLEVSDEVEAKLSMSEAEIDREIDELLVPAV